MTTEVRESEAIPSQTVLQFTERKSVHDRTSMAPDIGSG